MNQNLTQGPVMKSMLCFAVPMILGNLLQQCYNVADTLIVGRVLSPDALKEGMCASFVMIALLTAVLTGLSFAYLLSAIPSVGVTGIWWSVPIGWALADVTGLLVYRFLGPSVWT